VVTACAQCLRRSALVAAVGGAIDVEWRRREAPARVLAAPDEALLALAPNDSAQRAYESFDARAALARARAHRLDVVCRCADAYPPALRELDEPPAALFVAGRPGALAAPATIGIVGARKAGSDGLEVAEALGRGLSAAGVTVVSGMALGIDSAAHAGALSAASPTVAVLAAGAERAYPASKRVLYGRILASGCAVSEFPPGTPTRRWAFVARNRIIAVLSGALIVVEATERSGSLTTADFALGLGRPVGAVPGPVTSMAAAGTNGLLAAGAAVIRGPADALDLLAFDWRALWDAAREPGEAPPPDRGPGSPHDRGASSRPDRGAGTPQDRAGTPPPLPARLARLMRAIEHGADTAGALNAVEPDPRAVLSGLGELELRGLIRRTPAGTYVARLPR
jgi:DNA processing protein